MGYDKVPGGFQGSKPAGAKAVEKWTSWMGPGTAELPAINAVFKGGGPKGVAFAGALEELEGKVAFQAVSGASAGAITAALVAAGYSAATLTERIAALDFGSLLDERDWDTDDTVRLAYWSAKEREAPDLLTRIITGNDTLKAMMNVAEKEREEWSQKSWGSYLWDYGYWLLGKADETAESAFTWPMGDKVGPWAYWAAKSGASYYSGYGTYLTLGKMLGMGAGAARSWWYEGETNPLVLFPSLTAYAPQFLVWHLKYKLKDVELPAAIADKMTDRDSTLRLLLAMYYMGGAFKGDTALRLIEQWLQEALLGSYDRHRTITFREMPIPLHIVATDVTNQRLINFPYDLMKKPYGYTEDEALDFSVARAVRASMSIPLCFEPVELVYKKGTPDTGTRAMLVDGGVLSNYPVHAFMKDRTHKTVGFWLGDDMSSIIPTADTTLFGYSSGLAGALQATHDRTMVELMGDNLVTAQIDLRMPLTEAEEEKRRELGEKLDAQIAEARKKDKSVKGWDLGTQLKKAQEELENGRLCGTLDFALDTAQKQALIENGRTAGRKALGGLLEPSLQAVD